jgi:hypothetical protein
MADKTAGNVKFVVKRFFERQKASTRLDLPILKTRFVATPRRTG